MSLPSTALFKNADGEVVATRSINMGWFEQDNSMAYCLHQIEEYGQYVKDETQGIPREKWATVEMYGRSFTFREAKQMYVIEKYRRILNKIHSFASSTQLSPKELNQLLPATIKLGSKLRDRVEFIAKNGFDDQETTTEGPIFLDDDPHIQEVKIENLINRLATENPQATYKELMGFAMRELKGKCNPAIVEKILTDVMRFRSK